MKPPTASQENPRRVRTSLICAAALTVLACNDGQAPPPVLAGEFAGTADVDHGFYGFLPQLPVSMSLQQDGSLLSGTLELGTTTFTLNATVDLGVGLTTLQLTNAIAAGGSPSPCSGYQLSGDGLFIQTTTTTGSGPLAFRGEVAGTDCDGTMTVTFETVRQ